MTEAILSTVYVRQALYIHIPTKVIGTKVAVKTIPAMFIIRGFTSYAMASSALAGERARLSALTIIIALTNKKNSGHRSFEVITTKLLLLVL